MTRSTCPGNTDSVAGYGFGCRHQPGNALKVDNVLSRQNIFHRPIHNPGGVVDDADLLLFGKIIDHDLKHEPVQLGFRQGVGSLEFNGILGRQHEKRPFQFVGCPGCRHLLLLHGFKQGRLGLGRRSIDFICQQNIGKNRSLHEF